MEKSVLTVPGVKSALIVAGMSLMSGKSENVGMAFIDLKDWSERTTPDLQIGAIQRTIQAKLASITDASFILFTPPAIMGLGLSGGVTGNICGVGDVPAAELSGNMKALVRELMSKPETLYAMTPYNAETPQLYLDIDREKAETLGVATNSIYSTLQSKLASYYVNDFTLMGKNYQVKIQSTADNRVSLDDIRDIMIPNKDGDMVPLTSLGSLRYMVGPRQVMRFNKMTSAGLNAKAKPGVSSKRLMTLIEQVKLPENYHVEWTGMSFQEKLVATRMTHAGWLLQNTELSIQQIALQVGYASVPAFIRCFSQFHNCSPNRFRARRDSSAVFPVDMT